MELEFQKIPFTPQKELRLSYRGRPLKRTFKVDFVCWDKIILEIKAVSDLADEHRAQVLNYINATGYQLGILINFGHFPRLEHERLVLTDERKLPRITRLVGENQWQRVPWQSHSRSFA